MTLPVAGFSTEGMLAIVIVKFDESETTSMAVSYTHLTLPTSDLV